MKIFISWSGDVSHKTAKALRDWLPSVIQSITPYVSSEDIDKGARWSSDIASELDESSFGVLCVTPDNIHAPWLNFEAGALGKSVDKNRVCPFLFRIKRSDVTGPILQYQSTIHDKEDVFKLLKAINEACEDNGIEETRLEKTFEVWWPKLDEELEAIESNPENTPEHAESPEEMSGYVSRVLEEVLDISRTNQRLLRDPESLLPLEYFDHMLRKTSPRTKNRIRHGIDSPDIHPDALEELVHSYKELMNFFRHNQKLIDTNPDLDELKHLVRRFDKPIRHISKEIGRRLPRDIMDDLDEML